MISIFGQPGYMFLFEFNYKIVVFCALTKLYGIRILGEEKNEQIIALQIWVQIYNVVAIFLWIPQNEKKMSKKIFRQPAYN